MHFTNPAWVSLSWHNVKYGLDNGDGMVCKHKCFTSVGSGGRINGKLKWGSLHVSSAFSESALCWCHLHSTLLEERSWVLWVLSVGPLLRRWPRPFCYHMRDSSSLLCFLNSSSHFFLYLLLHPCVHPCIRPAHGPPATRESLREHRWSQA